MSPYITLIRLYIIVLNRFCFYYSLENNCDLFDSFKYFNLLSKCSKFLFNELINQLGFFLIQNSSILHYFKIQKQMMGFIKFPFNSNIYIFYDIYLIKYLSNWYEIENKLIF